MKLFTLFISALLVFVTGCAGLKNSWEFLQPYASNDWNNLSANTATRLQESALLVGSLDLRAVDGSRYQVPAHIELLVAPRSHLYEKRLLVSPETNFATFFAPGRLRVYLYNISIGPQSYNFGTQPFQPTKILDWPINAGEVIYLGHLKIRMLDSRSAQLTARDRHRKMERELQEKLGMAELNLTTRLAGTASAISSEGAQ